jgi:LemA protein
VATTLVLIILVGAGLYAIVIFNGLVSLKHSITKSWSNIDVVLKQRHDELPKLVETCKQYMQFERETLEKVMAARSALHAAREKTDVRGVGAAEAQMRVGLGSIMATAEAYPELKSNQSIQQLLARITGLENQISDRRELYNEFVNAYNVRLEQFPDTMIARSFSFHPASLLEFSEEEIRDVDVRALFRS